MGVFSADWSLLSWTPAWAVLMGDPGARTRQDHNLARAVFATGPVRHDDNALKTALVDELRATSPEFAQLWDTGAVGPHGSARKTVVHPQVGEVV